MANRAGSPAADVVEDEEIQTEAGRRPSAVDLKPAEIVEEVRPSLSCVVWLEWSGDGEREDLVPPRHYTFKAVAWQLYVNSDQVACGATATSNRCLCLICADQTEVPSRLSCVPSTTYAGGKSERRPKLEAQSHSSSSIAQ